MADIRTDGRTAPQVTGQVSNAEFCDIAQRMIDRGDGVDADYLETGHLAGFTIAQSRAMCGFGQTGPIGQPGMNRFGDSPTTAPRSPYDVNPVASGMGVFGPSAPVCWPAVGAPRFLPGNPAVDAGNGKPSVTLTMTVKPKEEEKPKTDTKNVSEDAYKAKKDELVAGGYSAEEADAILKEVKTEVGMPKDGETKSADERFADALKGLPAKGDVTKPEELKKWQEAFGKWYAGFRKFKGDGLVERVTTDRVQTVNGPDGKPKEADYAVVEAEYVSLAEGLTAYRVKRADKKGEIKENAIIYRGNDGKWYEKPDRTEPIAKALYDVTQHKLYLEDTLVQTRSSLTDATVLMRNLEGAANQSLGEETGVIGGGRRLVLETKLNTVMNDKFSVKYDGQKGTYTVQYEETVEDFKKLTTEKIAEFKKAFSILPPGTPVVFKFKNDGSAVYNSVNISSDRPYEDIYRAMFRGYESVPAEQVPASTTERAPAVPPAPPADVAPSGRPS